MPWDRGPRVDPAIKLDDCSAPDNNKDLDATIHRHGLLPRLNGDALQFLNGTGLYSTPTGSAPGVHATTHQNGGSDEISVTGLSGLLADPQTPLAHAASHQNGGSDEINLVGLSGLLADPQTPLAHAMLNSTFHSDALTGTVVRGDLIVGNSTPKWARLGIGATGTFLRSNGTDSSWTALVDADIPATLSANARLQVSKNSGATVGTRREVNFIEGTNITLTVADDAGNEEVDITIAAAGTAATALYTERATQNLAAAGATIVVTDGSPVAPVTSSGSFSVTSTPTIAAGRDGQLAIIMNTGTNTITLQDMGTLAGSGLRLGATTRALSPLRGVLELVYDTTMNGWIETLFTNVLTFTPSVSGFTIDGSSALIREVAAAASADATPTFAFTYVGVPTAASVDIDAGGGEIVGGDYPIAVPSPYTSLTSGTSPPSKAFYKGTSVSQVRTFTVTATVSGTAGLQRTCTATYVNRRYSGPNSQSTLLTSAQVLALDGAGGASDLSTTQYTSFSVSTVAGEYIWFAHRSALTAIAFFSVSSEIAGFSDMGTMTHTNDSGFVETFRLYRTINTNFGASKTFTGSATRLNNRIYMGPSLNATATILTAEILTLDDTANGTSRLAATVPASYVVTITGSNYLWFCHAAAIADLATIKDNSTGFAVSGSYRNNITHVNDMGFSETFRCWRSDNPGIFPSGGTVVVT